MKKKMKMKCLLWMLQTSKENILPGWSSYIYLVGLFKTPELMLAAMDESIQ